MSIQSAAAANLQPSMSQRIDGCSSNIHCRLLLMQMPILPSTVLAALLPILLLFSWPPLLASYGGSPGGYGSPGFGTAGFVYRCPVTAMAPLGYMSPYGVTYCGTGSLFHYYVCCDYNPTECCLQLEPWVIIGLVIVGILGLLLCIGCCALCFLAQRK